MDNSVEHESTLGSVYCARCDSPLIAEYSTADGRLVEFVSPCEKCLREVAMANAIPAFASMTSNITPPSRKPHGGNISGKRKCPDCGETRPRKKGQKRVARCRSCAKTHTDRYRAQYRVGRYYRKRYGTDWRVAVCPECGEQRERRKNERRNARCRKCVGEDKAAYREKYAEKRRIERAVNKRLEEQRQRLDSG